MLRKVSRIFPFHIESNCTAANPNGTVISFYYITIKCVEVPKVYCIYTVNDQKTALFS